MMTTERVKAENLEVWKNINIHYIQGVPEKWRIRKLSPKFFLKFLSLI